PESEIERRDRPPLVEVGSTVVVKAQRRFTVAENVSNGPIVLSSVEHRRRREVPQVEERNRVPSSSCREAVAELIGPVWNVRSSAAREYVERRLHDQSERFCAPQTLAIECGEGTCGQRYVASLSAWWACGARRPV